MRLGRASCPRPELEIQNWVHAGQGNQWTEKPELSSDFRASVLVGGDIDHVDRAVWLKQQFNSCGVVC